MRRSRWPAVVLFAFAAGFARAEEGAYVSLLGMARSAAVDRGPEAGPLGAQRADPDGAGPATGVRAGPNASVAAGSGAADGAGPTRPTPSAPGSSAAAPASVFVGGSVEAAGGATVVARPPSPASARSRRWALFYATLAPSSRRVSLAAPDFSTATVRASPPVGAVLDEPARAGARRGLAELLSTAASVAP
jgi:hypothetical protein